MQQRCSLPASPILLSCGRAVGTFCVPAAKKAADSSEQSDGVAQTLLYHPCVSP